MGSLSRHASRAGGTDRAGRSGIFGIADCGRARRKPAWDGSAAGAAHGWPRGDPAWRAAWRTAWRTCLRNQL